MERYSVHLKLLEWRCCGVRLGRWGGCWGSRCRRDGQGGSVCLGFGFVVGLVVCAQQVRDFGGFVGAAMAGFDGSRFCWRVRLCGVFMLGLQTMPAGKAAVVVR